MSEYLKLNYKDWINGLVMAVGGAIVGTIEQAISTGGLDVFSFDWSGIGRIAASAAVAYLAKKFFSSPDGKVFGRIG